MPADRQIVKILTKQLFSIAREVILFSQPTFGHPYTTARGSCLSKFSIYNAGDEFNVWLASAQV